MEKAFGETWTGYHGEWCYIGPMHELALLIHFKGHHNHHLTRLYQVEAEWFFGRDYKERKVVMRVENMYWKWPQEKLWR